MALGAFGLSVPNVQTSCCGVESFSSGGGSAFTTCATPSVIGLRTVTAWASACELFVTVMTYFKSSPGGESDGTRTWMRTLGAGGSATGRAGGTVGDGIG